MSKPQLDYEEPMHPEQIEQPLTEAIARVILLGPGAVPPLPQLTPRDAADLVWLIKSAPGSFAEIWRQNSAFLLREANRLGLKQNPSDGAWFGELVELRQLREKARRRHGRQGPDAFRLAFHEAAHAVLGVAFGLRVTQVRVLVSDYGLGGYSAHGAHLEAEEHDRRYREIPYHEDVPRLASLTIGVNEYVTMTLASGPAERRAIGPRGRRSDHDWLVAERLLGEARELPPHDPEVQRLVEIAERQAAREVDRLWPAITAVAEALIESGRLTGNDVRRIGGL